MSEYRPQTPRDGRLSKLISEHGRAVLLLLSFETAVAGCLAIGSLIPHSDTQLAAVLSFGSIILAASVVGTVSVIVLGTLVVEVLGQAARVSHAWFLFRKRLREGSKALDAAKRPRT